ncbi:MAG TPA: spirocyclase AveC family protein [Pseudonocardia sp.]
MSTLRSGARPLRGPITLLFAVAGAVMLLWQMVTLVRWFGRGHAESITQYRDRALVSWMAAHVFEAVFLVVTAGLLVFVVRGIRRERRFTLDAMIVVGLFSSAWLDPAFMYYRQIFLYSSQFVNVRAWCGDMPGILNPQCGHTPEPLIVPLLYVDVLVAALLAGWVIRRVRPRFAAWSVWHTIFAAAVVGAVFDFVMEVPAVSLDLWKYASGPDLLAPPGLQGADRYSLTTAFTFALITASVTTLRTYRNDRGESFLQRREQLGLPSRLLTQLAVIGFLQLTVVVSFAPAMLAAPYAGPWEVYPAQLTNGMCDNNALVAAPTTCR